MFSAEEWSIKSGYLSYLNPFSFPSVFFFFTSPLSSARCFHPPTGCSCVNSRFCCGWKSQEISSFRNTQISPSGTNYHTVSVFPPFRGLTWTPRERSSPVSACGLCILIPANTWEILRWNRYSNLSFNFRPKCFSDCSGVKKKINRGVPEFHAILTLGLLLLHNVDLSERQFF